MVARPDRRSFIARLGAVGAWAATPGAASLLAEPALAAAEASVPLRLTNQNTGEAYDVELFTSGNWNANALTVCDYLMRDWRQQQSVVCDRRLYAALYVIQRYFANTQRVVIHSGFRTEMTNQLLRESGYNAAPNSQHLKAKAVDFHIPGVDLTLVARAVSALNLGGVGLYKGMGFVHMDTRGDRVAWGDSF